MNSLIFVAAIACLAYSSASIIAPSAKIIQGPSTRTTVAGPDGSVISSVAPGGQIVTEDFPGVVAHSAPVAAAAPAVISGYAAHVSAPLAYSVPLAYSSPLAYSAYAAPIVSAYSAPLVAHKALDTIVAGPSGTIATSKTASPVAVVAAPSLYTAHGLYL